MEESPDYARDLSTRKASLEMTKNERASLEMTKNERASLEMTPPRVIPTETKLKIS